MNGINGRRQLALDQFPSTIFRRSISPGQQVVRSWYGLSIDKPMPGILWERYIVAANAVRGISGRLIDRNALDNPASSLVCLCNTCQPDLASMLRFLIWICTQQK